MHLPVPPQAVVGAAPKGKAPPPPPPEEADLEDELGEGDEDYYDPMEELNTAQRRRVLAMKEVQGRYDGLQREYQAELAQLQSKYNTKYGEWGMSGRSHVYYQSGYGSGKEGRRKRRQMDETSGSGIAGATEAASRNGMMQDMD